MAAAGAQSCPGWSTAAMQICSRFCSGCAPGGAGKAKSCCSEQVIRDIGRRVMEIQNAGLGEHKCVLVQTDSDCNSPLGSVKMLCPSAFES